MNTFKAFTFWGIGILLLMNLLTLAPLRAQETPTSFEGVWSGTLATPMANLDLSFDLKKETDQWLATIDVPAQGVKGFKASATTVKGEEITIAFDAFKATYTGTLDAGMEKITGKWAQGGLSFDLVMEKNALPKSVNRPQEPKAPFPYEVEDVVYPNEADQLSLAGTLSLPKTEGPHPVAILISGSGPQDRDETLMEHKPFLVLADYLTRQGIAVLRYDDRGVGQSTGKFSGATSLDFSRDVAAGIAYLKTRKDIDPNKIGLIGHSEGGLIAPIVASEDKELAFIVLLAGPGIKCDELLIMQEGLIAKSMGQLPAQIEKTAALNKKVYALVKKEVPATERRAQLIELLKPEFDQLPPAQQAASSVEEMTDDLLNRVGGPWMRYFLNFDPAVYLTQVSCPTLAINGEKDLQVPAKVNLEAIEACLSKAPCKTYEIKAFPNLNHLFQTADTGAISEYYEIEETFSPAAMAYVHAWISQQLK